MEHWQKITLGTIGGVIATFIFYYFVGKVLDYCYIRNKKRVFSNAPVPHRVNAKKSGFRRITNPALERFIHEEFESSGHECVAAVICNASRVAGICAFLQEMKIEFFIEEFPTCCSNHLNSLNKTTKETVDECEFQSSLRSALTAISAWGPKWHLAESINFLIPSQRFVIQANDRESQTSKYVRQFEEKYDFKLFIQWSDNYICDNNANDELWEALILCCKRLLSVEKDFSHLWTDFPCEEWDRTRIHVNGNNFHQLPHPGEISDSDPITEEKLVDI